MENYIDSIADALSDSGVVAPEPGHALIGLAVDYARALEAAPYSPERASKARDSVVYCLEAMGAKVSRFKRATRALGRRALPLPQSAASPDDLAIYEQPAAGEPFAFRGFERAS